MKTENTPAAPDPVKKKPDPVIKKTGYDIFNRVVKLSGKSVTVHDKKTPYKSQEAALVGFVEAINKTVW